MFYEKPIIEEEIIEIDDVIASSNGGNGTVDDGGQGVGVGGVF